MIMKLPQELIDSVVAEVDEFNALKACSLAGSVFRASSQRILHQSLTLSAAAGYAKPPRDYASAHTLLEESPHITGYIQNLTILLAEPIADVESIAKVLAKLTHVRWCIVDGRGMFHWKYVRPELGLASIFTDFLLRQPLRELRLSRMEDLPLEIIFSGASVLFFYFVSQDRDARAAKMLTPAATRPLEELVLAAGSDPVDDLFSSPQLLACTSGMRRLSVEPTRPLCGTLISRTAATLQNLQFNNATQDVCPDNQPNFALLLPRLPLLRGIEFVVRTFGDDPITWTLDTISSCILAPGASPALCDIVFSYWPSIDDEIPAPRPHTLAAFDAALTAHSAAPHVQWRRMYRDLPMRHPMQNFSVFTDTVKAGMPRALERGQLTFADCQESQHSYVHDRFVLSRSLRQDK
ncbi:hypothetical protein C8R43DRAFT_1107675 [Mycena crocata]|nr:hypothetical protein C8R43DRAFT_1107675 [Mycena crocata]